MSSVNSACRITLEAPVMVLSMKFFLLRTPMQPHGHRPISRCSSHAGVAVVRSAETWSRSTVTGTTWPEIDRRAAEP